MKKLLLIVMTLLTTASSFAVEVEIGGLWYELISKVKEAKIIQYKNGNKYSGDIVIPETIQYEGVSYNVVSIERLAFQDCSSLITVTIGNNITTIGDYSFYGCSRLYSVTIGNQITSIGEQAFGSCRFLKFVHISDLEAWCNISFRDRGANPLIYSHNLLLNGEEIKELVIPSGVTTLKDYTFDSCSQLTSVTIGNNVTSIGIYSFYECNNLTSVTIPPSVTQIGGWAFGECNKLNSVFIADLEAWCKISFGWSYTDNPLYYAHHLYLNGEEVKDLVIPNSVTSIAHHSFIGCSGLTSVTIPNSITVIENGAFQGCSGLITVTIPSSVKSIYYDAFKDCDGLTTLIIGDGVENIYSKAFSNCSELTDVFCYADNIPNMTDGYKSCIDAFEGSYIEYATLHVPELSIEVYNSTKPWKDFKKIVKAMPLYTLTYMVDGEVYKSYQVEEEATITIEAEPTKEGHTFSGWSEIPETMPANDVTVTGSFTVNSYRLTYVVDGEVYKTSQVDYGTIITPEESPTKTGYTFSGWDEVPSTMPARDVTVSGSFAINSYMLTYIVDGEEYKTYEIVFNTAIAPEDEPTREGHTFSGWSEIPKTMPANDVTVTGSFIVNKYQVTYIIDGEVFATDYVEYGAAIVPPNVEEKEGFTFSGWADVPETMPAHNITIYGSFTSGIAEIVMATNNNVRIYSPNGKKIDKMLKGLNIVVLEDGSVKKIVVK